MLTLAEHVSEIESRQQGGSEWLATGLVDTALANQPYRLELELAAELPSLHRRPPIGVNILSRARCEVDSAGLGQTLREAAEERCG